MEAVDFAPGNPFYAVDLDAPDLALLYPAPQRGSADLRAAAEIPELQPIGVRKRSLESRTGGLVSIVSICWCCRCHFHSRVLVLSDSW